MWTTKWSRNSASTKERFAMNHVSVLLCICMLVVLTGTSDAAVVLSSNFDDDTLQGWIPEPPFGGSLFVQSSGGNPGGFMSASDTSAGGSLLTRAPGLSGDLRGLTDITWDEYVLNIPGTNQGTFIVIRGTDGTEWESDRSAPPLETWVSKSVNFDQPSDWILRSGTSPFADVIANVDGVFINMGTTTSVVGQESGVDNIVVNSSPPIPVQLSNWSRLKLHHH